MCKTINKDINTLFTEYYVQILFDYVQTHAVYGIRTTDINEIERVKNILKEKYKATRFRIVKNQYGFCIICFKIKS